MESADITVQILRDIRDEIRETNERLDQTKTELSARLDQTREELGKHIVESEMRTATAITDLAGALGDVKALLSERLDLDGRVTQCEREIEAIKERIGA